MAAYLSPFSKYLELKDLSAEVAECQVLSLVPNLYGLPKQAFKDSMRAQRCTGMVFHSDNGFIGIDRSRGWQRSYVRLPGEDRFIREMHIWCNKISNAADKLSCGRCNLVMLHGYGGGIGFFYKNFDVISGQSGWDLYVLDLLGMGRSSRPQFCLRTPSQQGRTDEAENWFVDALEDWRSAREIDGMVLLGHSFGGYVATCYAIRHPDRVDKVIVASPVGVLDESNFPLVPASHFGPPKWLWRLNISPFAVLRAIGPLSGLVVALWIHRSFPLLLPHERRALRDYCHAIFCRTGSSEYALPHILGPGLWARSPLIQRIPSCVMRTPMVFLTGEHDELGLISCHQVKSHVKASTRADVILKAGHHVHLDAPEDFNGVVIEELVGKRESFSGLGRAYDL